MTRSEKEGGRPEPRKVSRPTMEIHEDGSATVYLPENYLGDCSHCSKREATHLEWCKFDPPVSGHGIFPDVEGIWEGVCDNCCNPDQQHKTEDTK